MASAPGLVSAKRGRRRAIKIVAASVRLNAAATTFVARTPRVGRNTKPPMKAVRTVDTASVVDPKTSVRRRVHSISRTRPEAPERKKQPKITGRMEAANVTSRPPGNPRAVRAHQRTGQPHACHRRPKPG